MAAYDVSTGYGSISWGEPPKLLKIPRSESDGSCLNLKEAKIWWLRNFDDWVDQMHYDLKGLRAADVSDA